MDALETYSLQETNRRLLNVEEFADELDRVKANRQLVQCMCGYYFIVFNDNLIYGPLSDLPIAEFMTAEEMADTRADCYYKTTRENVLSTF